MTRFRFTVVAEGIPSDEAFVTDEELGVGDITTLRHRRYIVERVENTGATYWDSYTGTTMISKRLYCRLSD